MPENKNEVDKFFEGLPSEEKQEADIFAEPSAEQGQQQQAPEQGEEGGTAGSSKEANEPRKNRRHRRLEQQLQEERTARLIAEARAEGRSEAQRFSQETAADVPVKWLQMYGDTPESRQAWSLQKELFDDHAKKVREDTIKEIETRDAKAKQAEKEFEKFIEDELESIEDEFDIDLTSDAPAAKKARREFLEMVQSLSPKGDDGSITGYADFEQTWRIYDKQRGTKAPDASRNKEIAARGMQRSGESASVPEKKERTRGFYGWQKDLNIKD